MEGYLLGRTHYLFKIETEKAHVCLWKTTDKLGSSFYSFFDKYPWDSMMGHLSIFGYLERKAMVQHNTSVLRETWLSGHKVKKKIPNLNILYHLIILLLSNISFIESYYWQFIFLLKSIQEGVLTRRFGMLI